MSEKIKFEGTVIRTELGGFAIVHFDSPIGPAANTHGIISSSTGTSVPNYSALKPRVRVLGWAEADSEHQLATISSISKILLD
jgi:hypothetical protein